MKLRRIWNDSNDFTLLIDRTMIDYCNYKYLNTIIRVFFSKKRESIVRVV